MYGELRRIQEMHLLDEERLDTEAFTPAYYQLARILRGKIMAGELQPGDRIPSEEALATKYGLSRMTARKAISLLVDEGLLRGERGRGTFVIEPKVDGGVFLIPDFHEEMRTQGVSTHVRLLAVKVVKAGKVPAQKLGIRRGKQVLYLERVLEGDGEPLVLDRKYMPYEKDQPLLEAELGHGSTTELFSSRPGLKPVRAELTLTATVLTAGEAELLGRKAGSPAFCMEQLIFAANDLSLNRWPVGTGPYMLTEFLENRRHVLERNPNFRGQPYPCEGEPKDKAEGMLAGASEVVMLNEQGYVAEGSGENIFIIKNSVLKTTPLTSILGGITRDAVITLARDMEYKVVEERFTRDELYTADEAFFTGTASEITPIREVDRRTIGEGARGPVTHLLQTEFFRVAKGENAKYAGWLARYAI